jgi:hypothetical protein
LKSPLILSLVYVGGTILASKRTPYDDLIASGFDENKLADRLQRQHKLICAAIHTGRIEDLKRQTERDAGSRPKPPEPEPKVDEPQAAQDEPQAAPEDESDIIIQGSIADFMLASEFAPPPPPPPARSEAVAPPAPPPLVAEEVSPAAQVEHVDYSRVVDYEGAVIHADELQVSLVDEKQFVAGEFVKINVHVGSGVDGREGVPDATVTLKVLGSSFRPLIFSGKTGADGVMTFYAMLPYFTSGRAAILVNAVSKEHRAELRRVIHQA